jgi:hypothetical protein
MFRCFFPQQPLEAAAGPSPQLQAQLQQLQQQAQQAQLRAAACEQDAAAARRDADDARRASCDAERRASDALADITAAQAALAEERHARALLEQGEFFVLNIWRSAAPRRRIPRGPRSFSPSPCPPPPLAPGPKLPPPTEMCHAAYAAHELGDSLCMYIEMQQQQQQQQQQQRVLSASAAGPTAAAAAEPLGVDDNDEAAAAASAAEEDEEMAAQQELMARLSAQLKGMAASWMSRVGQQQPAGATGAGPAAAAALAAEDAFVTPMQALRAASSGLDDGMGVGGPVSLDGDAAAAFYTPLPLAADTASAAAGRGPSSCDDVGHGAALDLDRGERELAFAASPALEPAPTVPGSAPPPPPAGSRSAAAQRHSLRRGGARDTNNAPALAASAGPSPHGSPVARKQAAAASSSSPASVSLRNGSNSARAGRIWR